MELYSMSQAGDDGNRRRTTYSHGPDAVKGFLTCGDDIVMMLVREPQLIQDVQFAPGIPNGLKAGHL